MPPQILSLKMVDKADALERHIEDLLHQKEILQSIETYTDNKLDFGDFLETYKLVIEEIERLQKQLREGKQKYLEISGETESVEEEEEEASSFSSKFNIENQQRFADLVKEKKEKEEKSRWDKKK